MEIKGGCLCGAVRYTAEADPTSATVCHCRDCQKFTGPDRLLDLRISDYQEAPTLHVSAARRDQAPPIAKPLSPLSSILVILAVRRWGTHAQALGCDDHCDAG